MSFITIEDLSKSYGENLIFENANYKFKKNKFNAILGKSGLGKTTLLNILMGIDQDYTGNITGVPQSKSVVFQENRLLDNYSIYDNLNFVLKDKITPKYINSYLKKLDLNIYSSTIINQLSGGMKRRISILRAVLKESDIYIFDEPFKDMDRKTHILTLEFIKEELKNKTLIYSTHSDLDIEILKPNIIKL